MQARLHNLPALIMSAVLAAVVYLLSFGLGSSRWEPVDPAHLAMLPELRRLAPHITIDRAMVYGFRFNPVPGSNMLDFVTQLRRDDAFKGPKHDAAALAHVLRVLEAVPAPDWWAALKAQDSQRVSLLSANTTDQNGVTLMLLDDHGYGQIIER